MGEKIIRSINLVVVVSFKNLFGFIAAKRKIGWLEADRSGIVILADGQSKGGRALGRLQRAAIGKTKTALGSKQIVDQYAERVTLSAYSRNIAEQTIYTFIHGWNSLEVATKNGNAITDIHGTV